MNWIVSHYNTVVGIYYAIYSRKNHFMVKIKGVKLLDNKQVSSIETTAIDYKESQIKIFELSNNYPDYQFEIVEMDDFSFLDLIHFEIIDNENNSFLN